MPTMKLYTGSAKTLPDSRTPRRFTSIMKTKQPSTISTLCGRRCASAGVDKKVSTPDEIDTATVIT